jgi:hypothetical protein
VPRFQAEADDAAEGRDQAEEKHRPECRVHPAGGSRFIDDRHISNRGPVVNSTKVDVDPKSVFGNIVGRPRGHIDGTVVGLTDSVKVRAVKCVPFELGSRLFVMPQDRETFVMQALRTNVASSEVLLNS